MPDKTNPPIYFMSLALENIRCFGEEQELKLVNDNRCPAAWTLIVGDNGVGKTTLLQCLARMRPVFNYPSDDDSGTPPPPVEPELAREEDNEVLNALPRTGQDVLATLEAHFSVGLSLDGNKDTQEESIATTLRFTRFEGGMERFEPGGTPIGGNASKDIEEPFVLGYGAGRHPRMTDSDMPAEQNPVQSLFRVEAELRDAEELLHRLDYSSYKSEGLNKAGKRLDVLKKILALMLPDIECPDDIEILDRRGSGTSPDRTGIHARTPYGKVPLAQLSLGYQTVFAWTVDIVSRLLDRYPESTNPLDEPAIILVDEIDLHLHPRWQREIRDYLTKLFPNVQFIVTAHSPLMAQSALDANVAVLRKEDDHAVIDNDPIAIPGLRLDQVITSDLYGFESARSRKVD